VDRRGTDRRGFVPMSTKVFSFKGSGWPSNPMPFITRILIPEEFTAVRLAELQWTGPLAGVHPMPFSELDEQTRQQLVDDAQYALDQLKAEGVIA
jgi:hypothetical protein